MTSPRRSVPARCFVLGCPRSGTTVLTRLLASHPAVAIGMERYKFVFSAVDQGADDASLSDLFDVERFADFRPGDTNIAPPSFEEHYRRAIARLTEGRAHVVGDKVVPCTSRVVRALERRCPGARYVVIHRDLLDVAASYCERAADPEDEWSPGRTHKAALADWNQTMDAADALLELAGDERLFPVAYDRLFTDRGQTVSALLSFLGLPPDPSVRERYAASAERSGDLRRKPDRLDARQRRFLLDHGDPERVAALDALGRVQRVRFTTGLLV